MLIIKMFDPILGVDIHMIITPAGVTLPVPHPFIGIVFDVFAWLPFIGTDVYTAGVPTAQAGTAGKAVPPHIPIGGVFAVPPGNEAEIFMGSATVVVNGAPQAFQGVMVLSCQTVGMPAPPRPTAKKKSRGKSLFLPTSTVMSIPAGKPVMIGGPPTIDVMAMLVNAGMLVGGKFFRRFIKDSSGYKKACSRVHDAARTVTKRLPENAARRVHNSICSVIGHPVDVGSGKVYTDRTDFSLPGPIPLVWDRIYYSVCGDYRGPLGAGWFHAYDLALQFEGDGHSIAYRMPDGRNAYFRRIKPGDSCFIEQEQITLTREGDHYVVTDANELRHYFGSAQIHAGAAARVQKIERRGAKIAFSYNDRGHLTGIVDSAGRELAVHNDAAGRISQIDAPHPKHAGQTFPIVRYAYDGLGDLKHSYDALDHAFTYEYRDHLLTKETNRAGLSFHFEYAELEPGRSYCTRTWGTDGIHDNTVEYDLDGQLTVVTNSLGHTTKYYWNELGLVIRTVDPLGHQAITRYTDSGRVRHAVDELGNLTHFGYDDRGNLTDVTYPDGSEVSMTYSGHRLTQAGDQNGGAWMWDYDEVGNLTERRNPETETMQYEYEGPNLVAVTDPVGNRSELRYDAHHNLTELTGADGNRSRYTCDRLGRPTLLTGPTGQDERRKYNLRGDVVKVTEPDGNIRQMTYDGEENPIRIKDKLRTVELAYKGMNRLGARTENGTRVEFKYDTEENLVGIINEHGYAYRFGHDPLGRVIRESSFDDLTRRYERDAAGRIVGIRRPGDRHTKFTLDQLGRTTAVDYGDDGRHRETYRYRADGQLLTAGNKEATVSYTRDDLGRVTEEVSGAFKISSRYDKLGNRTRISSNLGAEVKITRDQYGQVSAVEAADERRDKWRAKLERDNLGLEIERSLPGGVKSKWRRDALGRPTSQRTTVGGYQKQARKYEWGLDDRLKSISIAGRGTFVFEHDAVGNLAAATYPDRSRDYRTPDAVGNLYRTPGQKDRTYGPAGQLLRSGDTHYEYDAEGNLISKQLVPKDRLPERPWRYTWNASGTLRRVIRPDGQVVSFTYDALGRRLTKQFGTTLTTYVYDGNVLLHEWRTEGVASPDAVDNLHREDRPERDQQRLQPPENDQNAKQPSSLDLLKANNNDLSTWLFEPDSFTPMARLLPNVQYSVITDHLGTPTALYDHHGQERYTQELDIYGKVRASYGDKRTNLFRYPGQYEDLETGLSYNRFRYYDAGEGFYISQDPIGLAGGNPTLYGYVGDVNKRFDPFGLDPIWVDPMTVNYTQRTVSNKTSNGISLDAMTKSMKESGFDLDKGKPLNVMDVDGQLVSYDNRRLLAAQNAGIDKIPVNIINPEAVHPDSSTGKTWSDKFKARRNDKRNKRNGGVVPNIGASSKPKCG